MVFQDSFVCSSEDLIFIEFFVQNDKLCSVTKYLYYFIFLRKRNLIIGFPVTKGTFDPVSVLMLM